VPAPEEEEEEEEEWVGVTAKPFLSLCQL